MPLKINIGSSAVVFRKARFESPDDSQSRDLKPKHFDNWQNDKDNTPIIPFSPSRGLDDFKSEQGWSDFKSAFEEVKESPSVPILSLNIHIGNGVKKNLDIYNMNLFYKEWEDFCRLHNVCEEKQDLLINIIKEELQSTLTRIDEVEEDLD